MIGVHIKKRDCATYEDAIDLAAGKYSTNVFQIFLTNPRSNQVIKINYDRLATVVQQKNMHMYVHTSYTCRPWGKLPNISSSLISLRRDLLTCAQIGGSGVVLHLPTQVANLAESFARFSADDKILLEPVATKNADNYSVPEILVQLPYKICVDTAHLWSMGVNMRHRPTVIDWFSKMGDRIGLIHLNGSQELLRSGKDKHAVPFARNDHIWGKTKYAKSSCEYIVAYAQERNIDMIVENNDDTGAADISLLSFLSRSNIHRTADTDEPAILIAAASVSSLTSLSSSSFATTNDDE
jgi:endonuclease IV